MLTQQARKLWLALLLMVVILATLPLSAGAAYNEASVDSASQRMSKLGLIQGNLQGDLMLEKQITRAEIITILARAFGLEETATKLKGTSTGFADIKADFWASGYILAAKKLMESKGEAVGRTATTFDANANVSNAETIAFLMKFLGVKSDSTISTWPKNYIQGAVNANLISAQDAEHIFNNPNKAATRGLVFYYADYSFENYKDENDHSLYDSIKAEESSSSGSPGTGSPVNGNSNPGSTSSGKITIPAPSLENIHITIHPTTGEINVNVLNPSEVVTRVVIYDKASGGTILGSTKEPIVIKDSKGTTIKFFSSLIGTSFPSGQTHVYVVVYDAAGNASSVVEKPIA